MLITIPETYKCSIDGMIYVMHLQTKHSAQHSNKYKYKLDVWLISTNLEYSSEYKTYAKPTNSSRLSLNALKSSLIPSCSM